MTTFIQVACPNPDSKQWHTRFPMTDRPVEMWQRNHPVMAGDFSPFMELLVKTLSEVDGVICLFLNAYYLQVVKAPLFDWAEIDPHVDEYIQNLRLER